MLSLKHTTEGCVNRCQIHGSSHNNRVATKTYVEILPRKFHQDNIIVSF